MMAHATPPPTPPPELEDAEKQEQDCVQQLRVLIEGNLIKPEWNKIVKFTKLQEIKMLDKISIRD